MRNKQKDFGFCDFKRHLG
uniref:Uncharacterized protein n=1 Tax=Anguilla anguilla TaxID=7936 RepID=A0A0E9QRI0_ANGAN